MSGDLFVVNLHRIHLLDVKSFPLIYRLFFAAYQKWIPLDLGHLTHKSHRPNDATVEAL